MKRIVREFEFSPEEREKVARLAQALGITETTAGILFARGMQSERAMRDFLHPSKRQLLSPFLMRGMREATELLARARDEGWNVAVFGDYDADGIGALAVLSRALRSYGIEPYLFVPERAEGYGMSVEALDKVFDACMPDLIVTVDCGISNRAEVEYIKEQGTYVIVTDHHELPEALPDCIVINPKLHDDYPCDSLCGAGVAFKLAQALIGEDAFDLLDFAALSTVADSVPLLGENRIIVAEGLKLIRSHPRPAFSALMGKNAGEVTSQTLAFTLAPRINAAGRMGDAASALRLFTSEDEEEIARLAELLHRYNAERQKCCDELYAQAEARIREKGAFRHVIMLEGEEWNAGFVGIVAARLAEEYARPALLFVRHGDMLKGSARSIDSVNIFEALKACSQHIEEFGGHSQAAGVNVRAEQFGALEDALDAYVGSHYAREDFDSLIPVCRETAEADRRLAQEMNALEPFGVGNRRPLFSLRAREMNASLLKPLSPHVSIAGGALDLMYFGGSKDLRLLRSGLEKTLVYEYNLSRFRGREYLKGFVRAVLCGDVGAGSGEAEAIENAVRALAYPGRAEEMGTQALDAFLRERMQACPYGLCAVCFDERTPARFPALAGLAAEVFAPASQGTENRLLFAPDPACDLSAYREVVFLDDPPGIAFQTGGARLIVNRELCGWQAIKGLPCDRETLLLVFSAMRTRAGDVFGGTYADACRSCGALGFDRALFIFALAVFEELGIVQLSENGLRFIRGKRTELSRSAVYRALTSRREED